MTRVEGEMDSLCGLLLVLDGFANVGARHEVVIDGEKGTEVIKGLRGYR